MTSVRTLLLLFLSSLLVTMGKAKCLFPVLNGNHVLSLESRLKNEFPDGSTAVAECARGYEAKDGSPLITCQNGKWSKVELKCEKMDCGPPEPQSSHMTYLINNGTLFGAYVKALCDTGYDLEGSSYRQCLVTGWNGRATCTLITCDNPTPPEHGNVMFRSPVLYNDVIKYSCQENYTLVGNRSLTCGDDWDYNFPPPKCEAIECGVPTIKFGNQTEGNPPYLHKSQATFECLPGYRMNGSATSVCEERGWSALPECVKATPTPVSHSSVKMSISITPCDVITFAANRNGSSKFERDANGDAHSACSVLPAFSLPFMSILLQPEETTTVVASTVTTDIATTNAVFCKEEEEEEHFITVSQNNSVWIIVVAVLATLAIVCILCGLLHYNYKHKGWLMLQWRSRINMLSVSDGVVGQIKGFILRQNIF
ncbi:membrane cofactor protein isoform X8 [Danio rerio]|uniref:Membrane cofactor protein isoform X8 n=1 Tax=Danio rerio TaxID=7955 RepID=A0AC58JW36_DANRE